MLPRVRIMYENGLLGSSSPSDDGVVGMVASGVAVAGKMALGTAYLLTKLETLIRWALRQRQTTQTQTSTAVKEFYDEAPAGTKLWLMAVAESVRMIDICDKTKAYAKKLITAANGAINLLVVAKKNPSGYTATVVDGLDSDVFAAMTKVQALAEEAADELFSPLLVLLPGMNYAGTASSLKDLSECGNNRVCIMIGDTSASSTQACVGLAAGRIAAIPVQRSMARVKTGAISADNLYIGASAAENGSPDVVHDQGYICPRTFVGKAGYYWERHKLAPSTDDYALFLAVVIDKAYRSYRTLIEELNEEFRLRTKE